jgi:hypothetical protein
MEMFPKIWAKIFANIFYFLFLPAVSARYVKLIYANYFTKMRNIFTKMRKQKFKMFAQFLRNFVIIFEISLFRLNGKKHFRSTEPKLTCAALNFKFYFLFNDSYCVSACDQNFISTSSLNSKNGTFSAPIFLNPEGHVRQCTYNFRLVFLSISYSIFFISLISSIQRAMSGSAHTTLG